MKALSIFTALVLSASISQATSPMYGPYLYKKLGTPGTDATWADCTVTPGSTVIRNGAGNATFSKPTKNTLSAKLLETKVRAAVNSPVERALHVRATVPPVQIDAGVFPQLQNYTLLLDSSDVTFKSSADARYLITLANKLCKDMKAQ